MLTTTETGTTLHLQHH